MTDLRTGLVEAMARAWAEHEGDDWEELNPKAKRLLIKVASIMLDSGLGFLTDNAHELLDGPARLEVELGNTSVWTLIAALSDSRDTGEKP